MAANKKTLKALWPVATALVLFALVTGGWFWARGQAQKGFAIQQTKAATQPALTCSTDTWSGYPFQLKLECANPTIYLSRGRTRLTPKSLSAVVKAPKLKTIQIHLEGPTQVENDKLIAPVKITHAPATILVHLRTRQHIRAETDLSTVLIEQDNAQLATIDTVHLETVLQRRAEHDIELAVDLTNLVIQTPDGKQVILAAIATAIRAGNAPRDPVVDASEWLKAAAHLETQFNVDEFTARYGATQLHAEGTLQIEDTGTLDGTVKTRVTKLDAFLGDLQQRQMLTPKKAKAASTLVGLFDKGDGVAADLRLKGGEFFWGPLKLGRQPPLF